MSTFPSSRIPEIDPSRYQWYPHPTTPGVYRRRAFGPETKWCKQAPENRQLYITGIIALKNPPKNGAPLYRAAERAWLRLRFRHPEIAQKFSGQWNEDGSAILQCEIPQSDQEAMEWLERSYSTPVVPDLTMEVMEEEMRKQPYDTNPVAVMIHAIFGIPSFKIEKVAFCVRVDHQLADGIGAYLIAGKYLGLLADTLEDGLASGSRFGGLNDTSDRIEWAKAAENIPPAWVHMLNDKQKTSGPAFEAGVQATASQVLESTKNRWGLKLKPTTGYHPRSLHHNFSPADSKAILQSVKQTLGPTYTITHLGHAAMIMTLLRTKPVEERPIDQPDIVSPLFVNGRRYLDPQAANASDCIPICRAFGVIEFRDVERYIHPPTDDTSNNDPEELKKMLKIACSEAKRSYDLVSSRASLLTESFAAVETMATLKNDVKDKGMADPFFLNDGIIEKLMPRTYYRSNQNINTENSETEHKEEIFELEDVNFVAHPDGPPMIIRLSTFREEIRLSAEWNGEVYDEEVVQGFLISVVGLMGVFVE